MYICLCNAIREKQLDSAIGSGCNSEGELFNKLGCAPVCGKCIPEIRDSINDHRALCANK